MKCSRPNAPLSVSRIESTSENIVTTADDVIKLTVQPPFMTFVAATWASPAAFPGSCFASSSVWTYTKQTSLKFRSDSLRACLMHRIDDETLYQRLIDASAFPSAVQAEVSQKS
jgi:hypothetical protein